jgi:hypothetical protein
MWQSRHQNRISQLNSDQSLRNNLIYILEIDGNPLIMDRKISIAPMMDWTDRCDSTM